MDRQLRARARRGAAVAAAVISAAGIAAYGSAAAAAKPRRPSIRPGHRSTACRRRPTRSVTSALQSVALGLLEDHLGHCVAQATAEGGDVAAAKVREASEAIARLVKS